MGHEFTIRVLQIGEKVGNRSVDGIGFAVYDINEVCLADSIKYMMDQSLIKLTLLHGNHRDLWCGCNTSW